MHLYTPIRTGLDLVGNNSLILLHNFVIKAMAHEALNAVDSVLGVCYRLTLCEGAHKAFTILGYCHDRGSGARALRVLNNAWFATLHDSHGGVRCSQVDAKYFCHIE